MNDDLTHTIANDKTIRPSDASLDKTRVVLVDKTTRAVTMDRTTRAVTLDTTRVKNPSSLNTTVTPSNAPTPFLNTSFVIEGVRYNATKLLSESSGEAQIYLVENNGQQYVLKLYYPNFSPKENLLRILWNMDFEFVIKLFAFGKISLNGSTRSYELMEYLRGGTFNEYHLDGDFEKFRKIALACAGALAFCHNNNIIHKDIKPGNFFFRDEAQTEVVLGDFGISSLCSDEEMFHRTTQARTPIYAAPEMYENVIDREVEITHKIDFYSLGITLLFLWLKKNPFINNERSMMRMKSEGKLPNLDKLPEPVNRLIRGLTVVNPETRWGYDEVERWFRGEVVEVDETSVYLRYKSFIVDPEKNLVADNAKELASLLFDNKALGIKYLYSKRISKWLEECGNLKLSTEIDDIVEKRYPLNQDAGFIAAIFTLDRSFPYYDVRGKACSDVHEIALTLLKNKKEYSLLLQDTNDSLFIYLECTTDNNINRIRTYFEPGNDAEIAIWKLIYEIDAEIPFLAGKPSSTTAEIIQTFGSERCSEDEWKSLADGRLLAWINNRGNLALCEEIRILTENQPYSKDLAYSVLYHLDRSVGYDLKLATTKESVAEIMGRDLLAAQSLDDAEFKKAMDDYLNSKGRFCQYARLHGWTDVLHFHEYCFSIKSKENRDRFGFYDIRLATYKFCAGLGYTPGYYVAGADETVYSLEALDGVERRIVKAEIKAGKIVPWITIFFHENPFESFDEPYSYERAIERCLLKVGSYDSTETYYHRFLTARDQVRNKMKDAQHYFNVMRQKEKIYYISFLSLSALLALLLIVLGISNKALLAQNATYAVGIPVGLMAMLMAGFRGYFSGNGFSIVLLYVLGGAATTLVPVTAIRWVGTHCPEAMVPVCLGFLALYFLLGFVVGQKKSKDTIKDVKDLFKEDIKTSLLEPLNYTFRTKAERFKGSNFGMLDDTIAVVKTTSGEVILHYVLWTILMAMLVIEFACFHPKLLNMKVPDVSKWEIQWSDDVEQWKEVE